VLSYFREQVEAAPYQLQRSFVDQLRARGVVVGDSVRENFTPFLIPVGGPLERPGRGRVLLAGDAGGFVNGFTAEGIYYAMVSGDIAARTVAGSPASATDLAAKYRRAINREIGAELRDSVLLQRYLFADRRRIADAIGQGPQTAAITRLVLDFAMGKRSYRETRRRMLTRSPLLAARLIGEKVRSRLNWAGV
jgi:flavin-dependent dehydrogenase